MSNLKMLKEHKTTMPDMTIFMNLMVVLIPMLLVTAEFAKVATLTISLPPATDGSDTLLSETKTEGERLRLTAVMSDSTLTLATSGTVLPSYYYSSIKGEEHESVAMYATTEKGELRKGFFDPHGALLTNQLGNPVTQIASGDTVVVSGDPTKIQIVESEVSYRFEEIPLVKLVAAKMTMIKARHPHVKDSDEFTIAPQESVYYDKLVQLVDAANAAGYPQVAFSRLRHEQARN